MQENKNLKVCISESQEDIDKLNKKLVENYEENKTMNAAAFNKKYRTNIG